MANDADIKILLKNAERAIINNDRAMLADSLVNIFHQLSDEEVTDIMSEL